MMPDVTGFNGSTSSTKTLDDSLICTSSLRELFLSWAPRRSVKGEKQQKSQENAGTLPGLSFVCASTHTIQTYSNHFKPVINLHVICARGSIGIMIFFMSLEGFQSTGGRYPSTCLIMYLSALHDKQTICKTPFCTPFCTPYFPVKHPKVRPDQSVVLGCHGLPGKHQGKTPATLWNSVEIKTREPSAMVPMVPICSKFETWVLRGPAGPVAAPDSDISGVQSIAALVVDRWW
jgi:hypothetical protein